VIRQPSELVGAVVCVAALYASIAAADCDRTGTTLADIRARGALRVAHTNDYRPFSYRTPDGAATGIDVDVAERFAASLGVHVEWVDTTWSTLAADFAAHRFDVAMSGVSITADRAALGCFSAPYFTTGKTAMTRCATPRRFDTLAELDAPDVTIVVNRGGTNERFVAAHLQHARVIVRDDNRAAIGLLAAGGADAMITDAIEARVESNDDPALCVADPPVLLDDVRKAYYFADDAEWKAWIDARLAELRSSGEFDAIMARYLAPKGTP
jgi:ABC-type amino acid transport substrate-binding protein